MKKDDRLYLEHILDCITQVERCVAYKKKKFIDDRILQDAIVRNLQVMAESTQKLSKSLKLNVTDIPWHSLSSFRNVLVHDYLGIDMDEIYQTIKSDLPKLKKKVKEILKFLKKKESDA